MTTHSGESFLDWLRQQTPDTLSIRVIAHLVHQAADVLQDMHNHGRIHGHVTPDSFFTRPNEAHPGFPDLQLASNEQTSPIEATSISLYMAPEQWYGMLVPATDQYALAIITYQLLTLRAPFQGTQEQLRNQHLYIIPLRPSVFNTHIPTAVDSVVLRALSKKPEDRFPSIAVFASAFQQAALAPGSIPVQAPPASTPNLSNDTMGINRLARSSQIKEILMLGVIFLVVVSSIGFGFFSIVKSNQATEARMRATAQITTTLTANAVPQASTFTSGMPIFTDPLSSNTNNRWFETATCVFKDGTYHVLVQQASYSNTCGLNTELFADAAIQTDVAILSGGSAGLLFRFDRKGGYLFLITNQSEFIFESLSASGLRVLIPLTKTNAIGLDKQKNTLLIVARGSDFKFFINSIFVDETSDSTFTSGGVGLVVTRPATTPFGDASFSNFKVFRA